VHLRAASNKPTSGRGLFLAGVLLATLGLALMPLPYAHDLTGDAADRSILGFVPLGIEHMLRAS
jgi:hypothetical protein